MKIAFITTTINKPVFLERYIKSFKKTMKDNDEIDFFIIADKKTPSDNIVYLKKLFTKTKFKFHYIDFNKSEKFLRKNIFIKKLFPPNNAVRKYIGNIFAYKKEYELIMMIDDDNFIFDNDYLSFAKTVLKPKRINSISTNTKWFNVYESLEEKVDMSFYPRGYPWSKRHLSPKISINKIIPKISYLNGLVIGDPDIDAITRLFHPIEVKKFLSNKLGDQFCLKPGTWCSFNNQNSIIPRKIAPVHFTPPSGGRNSDIWASFYLCKLSEYFNENIAFGKPLVKQVRNPHDLWDDLKLEYQNNYLNDYFLNLLRRINLRKGMKRKQAAIAICEKSLKHLNKDKINLKKNDFLYMSNFFKEYKIWLKNFDKIKVYE